MRGTGSADHEVKNLFIPAEDTFQVFKDKPHHWAGDEINIARRPRARRACVHAAEASAEAVDLCCRAAGGNAVFQAQPFERALRDVRAAAAHIVLQRSAMEDVGRTAFGLDPFSPVF